MTFDFEVVGIERDSPVQGLVRLELAGKHDYTIYRSNLYLKLRSEDAVNIRLKQKFILTPVDGLPSAADLDAVVAEQKVAERTA